MPNTAADLKKSVQGFQCNQAFGTIQCIFSVVKKLKYSKAFKSDIFYFLTKLLQLSIRFKRSFLV